MDMFDIIGPIMIGPSSSHTAGAARIGRMARLLLGGEPVRADIGLYGSFQKTYQGHGTDRALIGGLLGMAVDDPRIPGSFEVAKAEGMDFRIGGIFKLLRNKDFWIFSRHFFSCSYAFFNTGADISRIMHEHDFSSVMPYKFSPFF